MSSYEQSKLITHLNLKWGKQSCPMCKSGTWAVSDKVMELREFFNGDLVAGGTLQPVIPVNCTNCGYTVLVNAILSNVIDRPKAPGA
jgi:predicted nucleic-acid-binding Zn-ribbon protein